MHNDDLPNPYPDRVTVCRLWQRTGRDGKPFFTGAWGGASVMVVENRSRRDDADATHVLVLAQARPRKPGGAA